MKKHVQSIQDNGNNIEMSPPITNNLGSPNPNDGEEFDGSTESRQSSPSKKKKKKRIKHRVNEKELYEVPGIQNLPAKRKTSYRTTRDQQIEATDSEAQETPVNEERPSITPYPGTSPFMSPPKALVPQPTTQDSPRKSQPTDLALQALRDTILKGNSRNKGRNSAFDNASAFAQESDGSPSPPATAPRVAIKIEHGSRLSCQEVLRDCTAKDGRFLCFIVGCQKGYTCKDSLSGHIKVSGRTPTLVIMNSHSYRKSMVTHPCVTMATERILLLVKAKRRTV
jgi:hypothetical protein